jgi:hypothetical protein
MLAVCIKPKPDAMVAPGLHTPVATLVPDK